MGNITCSCLRATEELPTAGKRGSKESEKGVGGQRLVLRPVRLPHGAPTFLLRTPGAWHVSHKPVFPLILPAFLIVALDSAVAPSAFGSFFKSYGSCSLLWCSALTLLPQISRKKGFSFALR